MLVAVRAEERNGRVRSNEATRFGGNGQPSWPLAPYHYRARRGGRPSATPARPVTG